MDKWEVNHQMNHQMNHWRTHWMIIHLRRSLEMFMMNNSVTEFSEHQVLADRLPLPVRPIYRDVTQSIG